MIVLTALLLPFVVLLLTLSVDIGNWWVHKRHLQLQVGCGGAGGRRVVREVLHRSVGRERRRSRTRRRSTTARAGSIYNGQVGNANKGTITRPLPEQDVRGRVARGRRHRDAAALRHAEPDVRRQGDRGGPAAALRHSGPLRRRTVDQRARARAAEDRSIQQDGMLPVAVPDLRFNYAFATFVNEANGAVLATSELREDRDVRRPSSSGRRSPVSNVPISASHIGVRIRLVGGTDPTASCGQLYTECYDLASAERRGPHPRLEQRDARRASRTRGFSPAPARRTRTSRRPTAARASRPRSTSARRTRSPAPA